MIRFVAVVFALAVATSAQAATPVAPLHQPDNMITQVRHACGAGMHMVNGVCTAGPPSCAARPAGVSCGVQATFAVSGVE